MINVISSGCCKLPEPQFFNECVTGQFSAPCTAGAQTVYTTTGDVARAFITVRANGTAGVNCGVTVSAVTATGAVVGPISITAGTTQSFDVFNFTSLILSCTANATVDCSADYTIQLFRRL